MLPCPTPPGAPGLGELWEVRSAPDGLGPSGYPCPLQGSERFFRVISSLEWGGGVARRVGASKRVSVFVLDVMGLQG